MLKDRKANPPKSKEKTLLDLVINYTDDEDIQMADTLELAVATLYGIEYCKTSCFRVLFRKCMFLFQI